MGTWGSGNFANDGSLDYVGQLMDQLHRPPCLGVLSSEELLPRHARSQPWSGDCSLKLSEVRLRTNPVY